MNRSVLSSDIQELETLQVGMPLVFDGNKVTYVSEALASAYKKGDCIDQHDHAPSQYSFTYYVNVPKGSSPLVFTTSKHKVIPKPGKLVMFESRLQHKVPPCKCDDRFAIAGNFRHAGEKGTYGRG